MSMIGNYLRITPEALANLRTRPEAILDFLYPEGDESHPTGQHLDIDKSWHAIHFLLNGETWEGYPPLFDAVMGGEAIGEEDVGYGPARSLRPEEVREVADALGGISAFELLERFDAEVMNEQEIYPQSWSGSEEERRYVSNYYLELVAFFRRASQASDAMILYLNWPTTASDQSLHMRAVHTRRTPAGFFVRQAEACPTCAIRV